MTMPWLLAVVFALQASSGLSLKMRAGYVSPDNFRAVDTITGISSVASCSIICKQNELNGYPCWAIKYDSDTQSCNGGHATDIKAEPDVGLEEIFYNPDQSEKIALVYGGSPGFSGVYENGALCEGHGFPAEYRHQDYPEPFARSLEITFSNHEDTELFFFRIAYILANGTHVHRGESHKLNLLNGPPYDWISIEHPPDETGTHIRSSPKSYQGKIFLTGKNIHSYDIASNTYALATTYNEPEACKPSSMHTLVMWQNYLFIIGSYNNFAAPADCHMVFDMDQPNQSPKKISTIPTWQDNTATCDITYKHQDNAHYILCAGDKTVLDSVKMLKLTQDENGNWPEWQEYETSLPIGIYYGLMLNYGTSLKLTSVKPETGGSNGDVFEWQEDTRTFVLDSEMALPELKPRIAAAVQMIPLTKLKGC